MASKPGNSGSSVASVGKNCGLGPSCSGAPGGFAFRTATAEVFSGVSDLLRDRDAIFGDEFREQVQDMGIHEVLSTPRSPWQRAYVERVIGSVRRECLDHLIVFNETALRRTLNLYFAYYHRSRTHLSLGKDSPDPRLLEPREMGRVVALPQVGGLHHRYERRAPESPKLGPRNVRAPFEICHRTRVRRTCARLQFNHPTELRQILGKRSSLSVYLANSSRLSRTAFSLDTSGEHQQNSETRRSGTQQGSNRSEAWMQPNDSSPEAG